MKRTGRVVFLLIVIVGSMTGLWFFQSWQEMKREATREIIHNVYIQKVEGETLYGIYDKEMTWTMASEPEGAVESGIADLILLEGQVVTIQKKPDVLQGKVLRIGENRIDVAEYGEVELDSDFRLYHEASDGDMSPGEKEELIVGNTDVRYIVAGKKICAAIVGESKVAKIRVLLKSGADSDYHYSSVKLSATSAYEVTMDGKKVSHPAGKQLTFAPQDVTKRVIVTTNGKGKIRLLNSKSASAYRGTFELVKEDKSFRIINEVGIEEYLYSVVPSEMPTEYPGEALKAQAICARSYAVQQMKGGRLANLGAHVDDTVSFQVYNNLSEDAKSIQAVNETKDFVVAKDNKIVTTYFYSVSCGCSEGMKDVWFSKKDASHLPVKWQKEKGGEAYLSDEKQFAAYLDGKDNGYDSASPWYRWQTTLAIKTLEEQIEKKAKLRYATNPTQIQTKQKNGTYKSTGKVAIGKIKKLTIRSRGQGGVARMLEIKGSENTLRIYTEYNIRYLLGYEKAVYKQADKKEVTGLSLLPSGFFVIEKKKNVYAVRGGGYGHGVGMSQYGAKVMAGKGKKAEEILSFYFPGTSIVKNETL